MVYCSIIIFGMFLNALTANDTMSFEKEQLKFERVRIASEEKTEIIKNLFIGKGISYPPEKIYFRVFKTEKLFEVWAFNSAIEKFVLINTYPICQKSGVIGPKRREVDYQVPEGFYNISAFNPMSNFFLSLGINYPNASDSILTSNKQAPGSDIYIHGDCVSIGCIPLTDNYIKEVYLIAMKARESGQENIPVDIYPFKFNNPLYDKLLISYKNDNIKEFWYSLKNRYTYFENKNILPKITISNEGKYIIQ